MRISRAFSCLVVVAALVGFATVPAASAAGVSVSVTPHKKLADGQTVSVDGSGFAAGALVAVIECPTTTVSPDACDLNTVNFAEADGTGSFSGFSYSVSRLLSDGTDCALDPCYLGVQDAENGGPTATAPIAFDPNIAPVVMTARIDKVDHVNSKGVARIGGTVKCQGGGGDVEVDLDLRQIVHRAIFESFGGIFLTCAADSTTTFHASIRPGNGLFGPGPATVFVFAQLGSHVSAHKVGITLEKQGGRPTRYGNA